MGDQGQSAIAQSGGFDISFFLMMGGMFLIVYFLMIRPQRKQQQEHQQLLAGLKKDDDIVLSSGIVGRVITVEDRVLTLEIAKGTRVKVLKQAVAGRAAKLIGDAKAAEGAAPAAKSEEKDGDKKSA